IVALVGYTNAGKSSLMNYFADKFGTDKSEVFEKDMLFATLDTKSKRIKKDNQPPFILIDTVGFISKLPPELISSFESTLSDIQDANLILHVVDGLNPSIQQLELTKSILKQLGMETTPRLLVVTKKDMRFSAPHIMEDYFYISSKTGEGLDELYQAIQSHLYEESRIVHLLIPFDEGSLYQRLKTETTVIETKFIDEGTYVKAVLTPKLSAQLKKYVVQKS